MPQVRNAPHRAPLCIRLLLLLAGVSVLTLVACESATSGTPALPAGFKEHPLPDVDIRGYLYIDPDRTVDFPLAFMKDEPSEGKSVRARRFVALLGDTAQRYAGSVEYLDEQGSWVAEAQVSVFADAKWENGLENYWISGGGVGLHDGSPLREKYSSVWELTSLLPPSPLAQPVAAGFLRDATAMSETLLQDWGIEVAGLGSALDLLRVSETSFVVYADGLLAIPLNVTDDGVREAGLGLVAVASSGYPGAVVDTMLDNFASLAGLSEMFIGEAPVQYRDVGGVVHLMVKAIGAHLFFALAPTRQGVQELMETVLASQR